MDYRLCPELVEWPPRLRGFVSRERQPDAEEIERTAVLLRATWAAR